MASSTQPNKYTVSFINKNAPIPDFNVGIDTKKNTNAEFVKQAPLIGKVIDIITNNAVKGEVSFQGEMFEGKQGESNKEAIQEAFDEIKFYDALKLASQITLMDGGALIVLDITESTDQASETMEQWITRQKEKVKENIEKIDIINVYHPNQFEIMPKQEKINDKEYNNPLDYEFIKLKKKEDFKLSGDNFQNTEEIILHRSRVLLFTDKNEIGNIENYFDNPYIEKLKTPYLYLDAYQRGILLNGIEAMAKIMTIPSTEIKTLEDKAEKAYKGNPDAQVRFVHEQIQEKAQRLSNALEKDGYTAVQGTVKADNREFGETTATITQEGVNFLNIQQVPFNPEFNRHLKIMFSSIAMIPPEFLFPENKSGDGGDRAVDRRQFIELIQSHRFNILHNNIEKMLELIFQWKKITPYTKGLFVWNDVESETELEKFAKQKLFLENFKLAMEQLPIGVDFSDPVNMAVKIFQQLDIEIDAQDFTKQEMLSETNFNSEDIDSEQEQDV